MTVICRIKDCKHRSKRAMYKSTDALGGPLYKCTKDHIIIRSIDDPDGDIWAITGESQPVCVAYEKNKDQ